MTAHPWKRMDSQTSSLSDRNFSGVVCRMSKALHFFTCLSSVTLKSFTQLLKKCFSGSTWQIWQTCLYNPAFALQLHRDLTFQYFFTRQRKSVEQWVCCGSLGLMWSECPVSCRLDCFASDGTASAESDGGGIVGTSVLTCIEYVWNGDISEYVPAWMFTREASPRKQRLRHQ